jgi:hypothetical protein
LLFDSSLAYQASTLTNLFNKKVLAHAPMSTDGHSKENRKLIAQWPAALVALGLVLTLIWAGLLFWLFLRLLHVM